MLASRLYSLYNEECRILAKGENKMKEKLITISLYILLAIIVCFVGIYLLFTFAFDDILNYYYGGVLKYIFILIMVMFIVLPIIKYRKHQKKWVLPTVLCLMVLITPIFNNGILKFVEDDLRMFSEGKWEQHRNLRIYMLDNIETRYLYEGKTEESVKDLLGEPDYVTGENAQRYEYFVNPGYIDPIIFYVEFENGVVVETGKYHS